MYKDDKDTDSSNPSNDEYYYFDSDAQFTQSFNDTNLLRYLKSKNTRKDILKKFEIYKEVIKKHQNDFDKLKHDKKYSDSPFDGNKDLFIVRKFMAYKNATLLSIKIKMEKKLLKVFKLQ